MTLGWGGAWNTSRVLRLRKLSICTNLRMQIRPKAPKKLGASARTITPKLERQMQTDPRDLLGGST